MYILPENTQPKIYFWHGTESQPQAVTFFSLKCCHTLCYMIPTFQML